MASAYPAALLGMLDAQPVEDEDEARMRKRGTMPTCNEMKTGETYECERCGLELKVVASCADKGGCSCSEPFTCCGKPLTRNAQGR